MAVQCLETAFDVSTDDQSLAVPMTLPEIFASATVKVASAGSWGGSEAALFQRRVCVCCSFLLSRRSTTTPRRTPSPRNREPRPRRSKRTVGGGGGGGVTPAEVFDLTPESVPGFCFCPTGNDQMKVENFSAAVEFYSKAIAINPQNAVYFCNRSVRRLRAPDTDPDTPRRVRSPAGPSVVLLGGTPVLMTGWRKART